MGLDPSSGPDSRSERAARVFLVLRGAAIFALSVALGYMIVDTSPPSAIEAPSPAPQETIAQPTTQPPPASPAPTMIPASSPASVPAPTSQPAPPPGPDKTEIQQLSRGASPPAAGETPAQAPGAVSGNTPAIPTGSPLFRIQVGAFVRLDNAQDRVRRLRSHGYTVTLVDGDPYRVLVGGYLDRPAAERLMARVRADGFEAALEPATPPQQQAPAESPSPPAEPVAPPTTTP